MAALRVLAVAALLGSSLTIAAPGVATATTPATIGPTTFYGRGYGHGVGMSQYGARGRALAGQLAPAILAHYYAKTTLGTRDPAALVRVLVLNAFAASATKPLTVTGIGGDWSIDGVTGTFPKSARLTIAPTAVAATTWTMTVTASDGTALLSAPAPSTLLVRPATTASYLELTSKATTYDLYRGFLRIRLTTTATVYNHVPLDLYLRGVVPVEMPSSWPVEALKAQAIASRSYAVYRLHPTTGSFDVYDDTRSQVYRGRRAETTAGNAAVATTTGVVVLSGTSVANTLYHSADGGWTENNENVFTSSTGGIVAGAVSYLRGSSDRAPDGTSYDAASPYATWSTATYTGTALSAIFAKDSRTNVGTIATIDLSHRGVSGRLISVTLTGTLGTKTVSGSVFIAAFNAGRPATDRPMRDTLFATAPIP
ncbi:MAG TPA: SpoIID/LytB domain-containing protein [Candidatus Limnocylindrales bacterium]|nr:SpoIID/LytB domain-containing protein [Candidatus Limnocylindrales bacterium]